MIESDDLRFTPSRFARRPGWAQVDTELRKWLRSRTVPQRIAFIEELIPYNFRYALSLVRSSQLPIDEVTKLLRHWLSSLSHNAARGLVAGLVPMLGEKRFWTVAARTDLTPDMVYFLNYYGRGKLDQYREKMRARVE